MLETRYYIYAQKNQLGPFTKSCLVDEIEKQNVGADAHIWAEGMEDWVRINEFSELRDYVRYLPETTNISNVKQAPLATDLNLMVNFFEDEKSFIEEGPTKSHDVTKTVVQEQTQSVELLKVNKNRMAVTLAGVLILVSGSLYYIQSQKALVSQKVYSHWDQLDVNPDELRSLKALVANKNSTESKLSIQTIKGDDREPQIAVVTNASEGAEIKIKVTGVRSSLVGAIAMHIETVASVTQSVAVARKLRRQDGTFLPPGQYTVTAACESCSSHAEVQKQIEIGISQYASYSADLARFHELVKTQIVSELAEISESRRFLTEIILRRLQKKTLLPEQQSMYAQLGQILNGISIENYSDNYVLYALYKELREVHTALLQMPAELGVLRRQLEQLFSKEESVRRRITQDKGLQEVLNKGH